MEKQCSHCKDSKPLTDFHRSTKSSDGRQSFCRDCNKKYQRRYMRTYRHTDNGKAIQKRFTHSEKGRVYSRKIYRRHRNKKMASSMVRDHIKRGLIPHPTTMFCVHCGEQATEYHHHKGYAKVHWYDVLPICTVCHQIKHNPRL